MSDPVELLERRIEGVISGEEDTVGLHFFCQLGGRYDEYGITTLQLSGSGWALLSWRAHESETSMYSLQLSEADMRKFYRMVSDHPFWDKSVKRRKPEDEETNIHFRISDQQKGLSHGIQFWTGDIEQYEELGGLVDHVCQLIRTLSDEEIKPLVPNE